MSWRPNYVTDEELAAYCSRATDDPTVPILATAASRAVDGVCGRQFGQLDAPALRTYDACDAFPFRAGYLLPIDDVQVVTGLAVTVNGITVTAGAAGYQLWPRNAAADGDAYTHLQLADAPAGDIGLTARFGWSDFPAAVVLATKLQGNRWAVREESPYGTAGQPSDGSTQTLTARLDPDVRGSLKAAGLVRMAAAR